MTHDHHNHDHEDPPVYVIVDQHGHCIYLTYREALITIEWLRDRLRQTLQDQEFSPDSPPDNPHT